MVESRLPDRGLITPEALTSRELSAFWDIHNAASASVSTPMGSDAAAGVSEIQVARCLRVLGGQVLFPSRWAGNQ